jgi:3-hydroxyisobutyrate dehydrogenase-like beta-hydroxyacid dehydrogenase
MGSNIVHRLMKAGHECVAWDRHPQAVKDVVAKGAKSSDGIADLVVGDKVYSLDTSDHATLDTLNKLGWGQAKVTGTVDGTTISVKTVTAATRSWAEALRAIFLHVFRRRL